jgi:hypothetical protein
VVRPNRRGPPGPRRTPAATTGCGHLVTLVKEIAGFGTPRVHPVMREQFSTLACAVSGSPALSFGRWLVRQAPSWPAPSRRGYEIHIPAKSARSSRSQPDAWQRQRPSQRGRSSLRTHLARGPAVRRGEHYLSRPRSRWNGVPEPLEAPPDGSRDCYPPFGTNCPTSASARSAMLLSAPTLLTRQRT